MSKPLKNPHLGSFAFAVIIYKLVTPLRYLSTVSLSVPIIKNLVKLGKIKPVPSQARLRKMLADKMPGKKSD